MQYFEGQLPPTLHALPQQARIELAELLLADDSLDDDAIDLPSDIEAQLQMVINRMDAGTEPMDSAETVMRQLYAKYT